MKKTRNNLVVSLDERGKDGEIEVVKFITTSTPMINIEAMSNKVSVHIDDLEEAIISLRTFQAARPAQPATPKALTAGDLNLLADSEKRADEELQQVMDFSN